MALQIKLLQKIVLSHVGAGVPVRSVSALGLISKFSSSKEQSNNGVVLKRLRIEKPVNCGHVIRSNQILHQVTINSYGTISGDHEGNFIANDNENAVDTIFETKTCLSDNEWVDIIDLLTQDRRFARLTSYDGLVMKRCLHKWNWLLANSYLEYLKVQNSEPNILALACYLQLCGRTVEECGEETVLDVYKQLSSRVKIFDATLSEHAILALTKTSEWKQSFRHLPVLRQLCSVTAKIYNAIIEAAFKNGEYETGWQLLETMCKEGKETFNEVLIQWINQCRLGENKEAMATELFQKLSLHDIYAKIPAAEEMMKFYREDMEWSGRYVQIFNSGTCPACNQQLEVTEVDEEAFIKLREEFVSRVLLGSDIFKTTSPKEWSRFTSFLKEEGPFTTIVDGLNVAYTVGMRPPQVRMKRLREAISKIKMSNRKGRIMVIGRKHMEDWSTRDLDAIKKRAKIFTLDNISKDDGFFIFAALQSGLGAQFVSSDFLRDHIYRLEDTSLKETFRQWQRKHQIFAVNTLSGVHLVPPPEFRTAPQKQGSEAWHIPYNDGSLREYEMPHTWMCLQSNPQQHKGVCTTKYVSEVPFKCSEEDQSKPYLENPKRFGIEPENAKTHFITLTDQIPGSKVSDTRTFDVDYGKFRMDRDFRALPKQSRRYSEQSKKHFQEFGTNSKYSSEHSRDFRPTYDKQGKGARDKMKKDMRNIVSGDKTSQIPFNTKGLSNKQKSKTRERIILNDIFKDK